MNSRMTACRGGILLSLTLAAGACTVTPTAEVAQEPFPVEVYARQRSQTNQRLSEISTDLYPRLRTGTPQEQAETVREIAAFAREHLAPHAGEVEELYAHADRLAGPRYTETMRYEHREIEAKIWFLEELARAPEPDVAMFRTKVNALVIYMMGHIDTETNTIAVLVVDHELERRRGVQARLAAKGGSRSP